MTCPTHKLKLIEQDSKWCGTLLVCPDLSCSYGIPLSQCTPETDGGVSRPEVLNTLASDTLEKTLVAAITVALEREGYEVLHVGQYRADRGGGNSVGYPDLSVRHPIDWPPGISLLLEAKVGNGRLSPRQKELHDAGWSVVVRSVADAREAVIAVEREIRKWEVCARIAETLRFPGDAWTPSEMRLLTADRLNLAKAIRKAAELEAEHSVSVGGWVTDIERMENEAEGKPR